MSPGNSRKIVPSYFFSFHAPALFLLWMAAAQAIYLLCLPLVLLGLYLVGYFDPFVERKGLAAAGRILLAYMPAALLMILIGLQGRSSASRLWPASLVCSGAVVSYLLGVLFGRGSAVRAQHLVAHIGAELSIDSAVLGEMAATTGGRVPFVAAPGPGAEAGMLASIADGATASPDAERRSGLRRAASRVYRFRRGVREEPAGAEADLSRLCETSLGRIPVELAHLYDDEEWRDPSGPVGRFLMRTVDILLAAAAILLLSPLFLVAAAAVWIEDGRPIVLRQIRIGRGGEPFVLYKFRTMKQDGFNEADPNSNMASRILRVGGLMRKTHVDETLQFVNVLRGTMSLVGPRPELPVYHERGCREIPAYVHRLRVRPGITGWAQVRFPHTTSIDEYRVKTSYDLWYIRNRSGWLNIAILLLTVRAVLFGTGK